MNAPLITTDISGHGPEIEYLVDHGNGLKVANNIRSVADAIRSVLQDASLSSALRRGCREAASRLTFANMVEHFAEGVLAALRLPSYPRTGTAARASTAADCHNQLIRNSSQGS